MALKKKATTKASKTQLAKKPAPAKKAKSAAPAKKPVPAKKPATVAVKSKTATKKAAPVTKIAPPLAKKPALKATITNTKSVSAKTPLPTTAKPEKSATKKPEAVQKPAQKPMAKKTEEKKPIIKEVAKAPTSPKATAKNIKDIKVIPPKPVVLPKINTKTSRTYQPDFTKSVLDQPQHDPGAPIVRYNDADLMEFRELIGRKLEAAKKELNYLQGLITRKDDMGGDESDNRYMTMEDGSLSMEREQLSQMASRQITFIDHLEKAIMRIENKTYGICRVTGKLIDKARLRAVPHATLCIEAKMGITK
jgi:RNA polymerase-binding transcription factor DksA